MRTKKAFKMKQKAFFINFKGLSIQQITPFFSEADSPTLSYLQPLHKEYKIKIKMLQGQWL